MAAFFVSTDIYMKNKMVEESKSVKRRMSHLKRPCRTKSTCASSPFDSAKLVRNTETAKQNLKNLAEKYKGINNVEGFLTDLWVALGLQNQGGKKKGGKPSRYALYQLQDGTKLSISIRASAHNANANKYVEHPPVPDINLSIVLQKKMRKNQFKDNPSVNIGEYVYVNQKIRNVESPLSQIANSLIGFLSNGEYNDTTGVAIVHGNLQTPQEVINNQTLNCSRNMNKKLIRLTESDLKQIVKESVKKVLKEDTDDDEYRQVKMLFERFRDIYRDSDYLKQGNENLVGGPDIQDAYFKVVEAFTGRLSIYRRMGAGIGDTYHGPESFGGLA